MTDFVITAHVIKGQSMRNKILGTAHFGPVYAKKIHVWIKQNSNVTGSEHTSGLIYAWSTNAAKTCRDAIAAAKEKHPAFSFVANFAKD
jgi:hypothetical protein